MATKSTTLRIARISYSSEDMRHHSLCSRAGQILKLTHYHGGCLRAAGEYCCRGQELLSLDLLWLQPFERIERPNGAENRW